MIRKTIWTFAFGKEIPEVAKKCIASQKACANQFGYEHFVLTEKNFEDSSTTKMAGVPEYIKVALENNRYVKAKDYAMAWILYNYGGIGMDYDQEILPGKNFDHLLGRPMFVGREENGFLGYSLVGSEAGHPLWEEYFKQVEERFHPLDGKNFESSMELFTHLVLGKFNDTVFICEPTVFFPYNHQTGLIHVEQNTVTFHHFMKTWTDISPDILPTVSIIIPQLGRPEGLKRCLDSIDRLYYPKHLIEVLIETGDETVPVKVKRSFERSKGEVLAYASNDIEFEPMSLYNAVKMTKDYGVVTFNTGELLPDSGNIAEHFVIRRDFVPKLEKGEIFDTDFHHIGCDNFLYEQAKRLNQVVRCENAIVHHYHFSTGAPDDDIYKRGWSKVDQDRELLKLKLQTLS